MLETFTTVCYRLIRGSFSLTLALVDPAYIWTRLLLEGFNQDHKNNDFFGKGPLSLSFTR